MNIIDRFKNQRVSQLIHLKFKGEDRHPARVCNCLRLKNNRSAQVSLRKKEGATRAHYGDLQTCGSVWDCQVCSSIISERRSQHTQKAIDIWQDYDSCNAVSLITWTTPHHYGQSLAEVLGIQDKAMRIMKQQPQKKSYKVYRTVMAEMCSIGAFTGREVNLGLINGWHPHRHDLHFLIRAVIRQIQIWREELAHAFSIAFVKAGGVIDNPEAFMKRSVRIDQVNPENNGFTRVSDYIAKVDGAKWTIAQEATKGIVKMAKNGNMTPFGLLEAIRHHDDNSGLYAAKFYEYSTTMKGKRQFFPSKGLNQFFGLDWKTDQEVMQESKTGNHYSFISDPQWQQILDLNMRGEILHWTEDRNEFEFMDFLDTVLDALQIHEIQEIKASF